MSDIETVGGALVLHDDGGAEVLLVARAIAVLSAGSARGITQIVLRGDMAACVEVRESPRAIAEALAGMGDA